MASYGSKLNHQGNIKSKALVNSIQKIHRCCWICFPLLVHLYVRQLGVYGRVPLKFCEKIMSSGIVLLKMLNIG